MLRIRRFALLFVVAASVAVVASSAATGNTYTNSSNPPWYPSLQAFEHYDSARSHVFSQARFHGSLRGPGSNQVQVVKSRQGVYSSGYNMSWLDARNAFIQGGSYGNIRTSTGPFVAKVDPTTLKPVWWRLLRNTKKAGEWDYPGAMAIMADGFIYVVSGYRIYKVDPAHGRVVKTLQLPTLVNLPNPTPPPPYQTTQTDDAANTSYNGINALPDGTIIVKSLYRGVGCGDYDGPTALLSCPDSGNVPQSILASVDPRTMTIIDQITLPAFAGARPTITTYKGVDYVYLLEKVSSAVRYAVVDGHFHLDTNWTPAAVSDTYPGQTVGASLMIMGDWVLGATNSVPAAGPLTVFAINQGDARRMVSTQPYATDPIPPGLAKAFGTAAAGNTPAHSWAGMSLEADPENGMFYGVETLARKVAAFKLTSSGIQTVWKKTQTTTEWATLIGPKNHRVWVGTEIPTDEIPGKNHHDRVVWRDARTGRLLARSATLPSMTQGSAIQPGYGGSVFFPSELGQLIKLTPRPTRG